MQITSREVVLFAAAPASTELELSRLAELLAFILFNEPGKLQTIRSPKKDQMISLRRFTVAVFLIAFSASLIHAQDLSSYRNFQFGMNLGTVAVQAGMNPAEAKTLHQRPALIQELWWKHSFGGSPSHADPVREVVFSFYGGALSRMVVNYDRYRTEGLTDEDMIEAISAKYGIAARPVAVIVLFSSSHIYNDHERVIARWEDSKYSYNLYRSSNQPTFGMLIFSKRLDALAQSAIAKAILLDNRGAPQ